MPRIKMPKRKLSVKELRVLLADMPDDANVSMCIRFHDWKEGIDCVREAWVDRCDTGKNVYIFGEES